jgi:hypothetical protein
MSKTLIYIDNQLADIYPGTAVACSLKALEFGDLKTRNANYTNRFQLPKTAQNKNIFGFSDSEFSLSSKPYTKLPARLILNGIEVISTGIAYIVDCDEYFNINIFSGTFGFFDSVGEGKLLDLDLSDYDLGASSDLLQPIVDDGSLDETSNPLDQVYTGYAFPYKILIEEIIAQAGYSKTGDIFSDAKLAAMYMSALGYEGYNFTYRKSLEYEAFRSTAATHAVTSSYTKIDMTVNVLNPSGMYDGTNTFTVVDPQGGAFGGTYFLFDVYATLEFTVALAGGASGVDLSLFSNSGEHLLGGLGNGTYELELTDATNGPVSGIENTEVYLRVRTTSGIGTATLTFTQGQIYSRVRSTIQVTYVAIKGILPDYLQRNLLRDFLIRFGVILRETGPNSIEAVKIEDIITDRVGAVDWTTKRDISKEQKIQFDFRSYAQTNHFKYSVADDLVSQDTGKGELLLSNENLDLQKDFFTSDFNSSDTVRMGNEAAGYVTAARIPISDGEDPGLRLLLVRDKYSYEPTLAGPLSSYKVGYFEDGLADHSLNWQTFIDTYYASLSTTFERPKVITRYYFLTAVDIAQLDLLRLVFDNGAYFIINTVENFIPGQSTKVELFKVS